MKNEAREARNFDRNLELLFCKDMQAVLLSSKSNVSSLYFKMKLMVHNFTIYNLKPKAEYCFIWHEASGGVSANEYSSIICFFIEHHVLGDLNEGQNVVLYSDGCTSQNRNSTLSSALLHLTKTHKVTIEQKYLEKGHMQMEADSMHSCIKRKLKNTIINVPADYENVCLFARRNPSPYVVKYLNYDFSRTSLK